MYGHTSPFSAKQLNNHCGDNRDKYTERETEKRSDDVQQLTTVIRYLNVDRFLLVSCFFLLQKMLAAYFRCNKYRCYQVAGCEWREERRGLHTHTHKARYALNILNIL